MKNVDPAFNTSYQKLVNRVVWLLVKILPKTTLPPNLSRFVLNYIDPHLYMNGWFLQPFNGQAMRYRQIINISERLKPTVAIETGTFLGSTTPILSSLVSGKTFTIEFVQKFAEKARKRFESHFSTFPIELIIGDSGTQIHHVLQKLDPASEVLLAYLDAHWEEEIPTTKELTELIAWGENWIAVIDDFRVPGDDSYGFDKYDENTVDKSMIPDVVGIRTFVPKKTAETETGARRGTAYVFGPAFSGLDFAREFPELRSI
jgi:hypothetical protein